MTRRLSIPPWPISRRARADSAGNPAAAVLRTRVASAAVLVPVVLVIWWAGLPWLGLLVLLIAALAAWETFVLLRLAGYVNEPLLGTAVALVIVAGMWLFADLTAVPVLFVAIGVLVAAVAAMLRTDPFAGLQAWIATVFGALYVSLLGFLLLIVQSAAALPVGAALGGWFDGGRIWLLIAILAVWSYDSGAYLVGRRFGRTTSRPTSRRARRPRGSPAGSSRRPW